MIHEVVITELAQIRDARGAVLHMLRIDAADFSGFGECYFSEISPGAIKAWKRHRAQAQNLAVPIGRVRLAIYDDRQNSPTRDMVQEIELGRPDAYLRVRIPPGLWYGFECVGDTTALLANCTDLPHEPKESESKPADDPAIPYHWGQRSALQRR
jgi:dTDP-4-dehydrorhamnose 3,5-epimerase